MNKAIKQQIQAKFDKYQSIKSRINRYPQWMMAFHEGIPGCDYSSEDLHRISQQTQKLFGCHAVDAFSPSRIRELAKYTQVSSPLVFLRDNTVSNQMEFHLMNKYHGLVTLSSRRYEANLRSIFSDSEPEDVCSPFIESQKILENVLYYSEIICAASMMMLAFIEQKEVLSCHQKILNSNSLEEIERYQEEHSDFQEITPDMLRNIIEVLLKKRSFATFLADFIQEIIDDLSDLLSITNHLVIFQRSTASLAQGLFQEFSYTKASPVIHSNSFK